MEPEELEKKEDLTPESDEGKTPEPSQDPVKAELERVQRNTPRTEAEKAAFTLKKNAERVKELGLDPASILGVHQQTELEDDNSPVTIGMLKKIEADKAQRTAVQLAEDIQDANERELTKHHLEHTIRPSGNPQEDLRAARAIVNSVKNGQILQEMERKGTPSTAAYSGAPANTGAGEFIPTAEEAQMMRPPFSLSKEAIIAARKAQQQ